MKVLPIYFNSNEKLLLAVLGGGGAFLRACTCSVDSGQTNSIIRGHVFVYSRLSAFYIGILYLLFLQGGFHIQISHIVAAI